MIRVVVERIEDGEVASSQELEFKNLLLLGEQTCEEDVLTEMGFNVSIGLVASMLLSGSMTSKALILSDAMKKIRDKEVGDHESSLLDAIIGGLNDGTDS